MHKGTLSHIIYSAPSTEVVSLSPESGFLTKESGNVENYIIITDPDW